ncbi:MAG: XrtA/PEP-CTERM system histidine kinase PrsK [Candidatus Berkiella sp.]
MLQIASISHNFGAVVFLTTTILLCFHRSTREKIPLLIISTFITSLWCIFASLYIAEFLPHYGIVAFTEALQDVSWCFCLVQLIGLTQNAEGKRWFNHSLFKIFMGVWITTLAINAVLIQIEVNPVWMNRFANLSFIGNISMSVIALALIEQLYLGTMPERRGGIQFIACGLGLMFCYDFYLFANALLLGKIDPIMWEMRGAVCALIAPFITLGVFRNQNWHYPLAPSRKLIFSSTAFVSCGVYLLIMASVGYGIRQFGGNWGKALQVLFLSSSLLVLALLLTSGRVRAFISQLFAKNLFRLRYDYRQQWLNISNILSENENQNRNQLVIKMMADLVESPKGWLFEKGKNNQFSLIEGWNIALPAQGLEIQDPAFAAILDQLNKPIDLSNEPLMLPEVIREQSWIWLVIPLKYLNHCAYLITLGFPRTSFTINWEVQDVLMMVGRQLAVTLVQAQAAKDLMVAKQFEAFNQVSTFIAHDLKNIAAQLALMSKNKEKHGDNPKFVASVYQTIDHLNLKFDKLLKQINVPTQEISEKIALRKALAEVLEMRSKDLPIPSLSWNCDFDEIEIVGDYSQFVNILTHLVENAQQATPYEGTVNVEISIQDRKVMIKVIDTGKGMSQDFMRSHLFKPFVSTKGKKGMGIGVFQAKTYVENQKGRIQATSQEGLGTQFCIEFPILHVVQQSNIIYRESDIIGQLKKVSDIAN